MILDRYFSLRKSMDPKLGGYKGPQPRRRKQAGIIPKQLHPRELQAPRITGYKDTSSTLLAGIMCLPKATHLARTNQAKSRGAHIGRAKLWNSFSRIQEASPADL
jgi:hypothetical protein